MKTKNECIAVLKQFKKKNLLPNMVFVLLVFLVL